MIFQYVIEQVPWPRQQAAIILESFLRPTS
jgi:hypothetical protein